jgi:hypothetical protein
LSNDRSINDGYPLGFQGQVNAQMWRLSVLRPAKIWHDRFQKGRRGSYTERKKAISDYIRFLAFFDQPVRQIFADEWVKATIQQAANEADDKFFKQFGKKLEDPSGYKNFTEGMKDPAGEQHTLDTLDSFLIFHWAEAHGGLPELCALTTPGLLLVLDYEPTLRALKRLKRTIGVDDLTKRCYRRLKLPSYSGERIKVEKSTDKTQLCFTKPDGTSFRYPDPNYHLEKFLKAHWTDAYGGLPRLCDLTKAGLKLVVEYEPMLNYLKGMDVDRFALTQTCCERLKKMAFCPGENIRVREDAKNGRLVFTKPDGKSSFYPVPSINGYWDSETFFFYPGSGAGQGQQAQKTTSLISKKEDELWFLWRRHFHSRAFPTKHTP